jgi:hypothetical protein
VRVGSLVAAVAALALTGGCGGEDQREGGTDAVGAATAKPVGTERAGSVTQYADCDDWRAGSPAERRATVVELRRQLTPQTSETAESPLADARAYEILQKACKPDYAGSLRLYKLYVRAQAFAPLND